MCTVVVADASMKEKDKIRETICEQRGANRWIGTVTGVEAGAGSQFFLVKAFYLDMIWAMCDGCDAWPVSLKLVKLSISVCNKRAQGLDNLINFSSNSHVLSVLSE